MFGLRFYIAVGVLCLSGIVGCRSVVPDSVRIRTDYEATGSGRWVLRLDREDQHTLQFRMLKGRIRFGTRSHGTVPDSVVEPLLGLNLMTVYAEEMENPEREFIDSRPLYDVVWSDGGRDGHYFVPAHSEIEKFPSVRPVLRGLDRLFLEVFANGKPGWP